MDVAKLYAERSHAERIRVGCIIVKDNRVLSIGINGMPSGWDNNCETKYIHDYGTRTPVYKLKTKPEVLHAETNAIAKIARSSESCEGCYTLYDLRTLSTLREDNISGRNNQSYLWA